MPYQNQPVDSLLMSRLGVLRDQEILTDIMLKTDDEIFKAHKIILSCHSEYFFALCTDPMLESQSNEVFLSMVTSRGLKAILDYIYTSNMDIHVENVVEVLHAATYLQVQSAISLCDLYLRENITNDNVLDIVTIADRYSLTDLMYFSHMHLANNLTEVVICNQDFFALEIAQMEYFLASDLLIECPEYKVLEYLLYWFQSGEKKEVQSKLNQAQSLLKKIIFSDISNKQLCTVIAKVFPHEKTRRNHILYKRVLEQKFLSETKHSIAYNSNLLANPESMRGMEKAFVSVGGISNNGITNDLSYTLINTNEWRPLTKIPHIDQCNYGTAVYKNVLYIIGGCYNEHVEEILHPYAFSYDPRTNDWKNLDPMRQARCRFTLTLLGDSLYAVGGCIDTDTLAINPLDDGSNLCDKYIVSKNLWESVASLPLNLCQHAACTLSHQRKEYLFVSGGLQTGIVSNKMYAYNPVTNTWTAKRNLIVGRVDHSMFQYKNKLYVCGGWNCPADNPNERRLMHTIDVYDPAMDDWQTVAHKTKLTYHCAIVMNESRIYFIGGFNHDNAFSRTYENVEYYDIDTDSWTIVVGKPPEIWEHNCVIMFVPKRRL